MEKGKIKIDKKGKVKKFDRNDGKGASVPNIFDFTSLKPDVGTKIFDCEYEIDEKERVSKIIIEGKEVPFIQEKLEEKKKKDQTKQKQKALEDTRKKEAEDNKKIIEFYKDDFVDMDKTFIPKDTENVLRENEWKIDNFRLKFNKLARYEENEEDPDKSKFQFFSKDNYKPKQKFSIDLIKEIYSNEKSNAESLFKNADSYKILNLESNWRLTVGLGGESVYETSITLHHIYGIPYIPASAVKGVVRSYIISEVFAKEDLHNAEGIAIGEKAFCDIFGCPAELKIKQENGTTKTFSSYYTATEGKKKGDRIGKITFFDAFPFEEPKIEPDIMNVHYKDYYNDTSGKVAPTDYQSPNPIPFLTVKDTQFQFIIGAKKEKLENFKIKGKTIEKWLIEALSNHGIGAKTAAGYGRMTKMN